jgi:hypothetical protein
VDDAPGQVGFRRWRHVALQGIHRDIPAQRSGYMSAAEEDSKPVWDVNTLPLQVAAEEEKCGDIDSLRICLSSWSKRASLKMKTP